MQTTAEYLTVTATFITITATSNATTCRVKSNEMKISRSIQKYRLSKGHISNVIAMANCIKL